jgi:protein SCO1
MASITKRIFTGLICLLLSFGTAYAGELKHLDASQLTGTVLDKPKPIKNFSLKKTDGTLLTTQSFMGHWTLLFFGFTRCGYVCPTSLGALKNTYEALQKSTAPKPQIIFVSIDPERDDLARIHRYVTSFNKDFMGATGSKTELNALTSQLGILYMKVVQPRSKKSDNYDIDHSGSILLVDPEGRLIAVFSMPHKAESIAKDYKIITSHYV